MSRERIIHPFGPIFDENSKTLILGSFPSVKSREQNFFYGHPQNRFWIVTSAVFECDVPKTIEEKQSFLLSHHLALWDVIESCDIKGSADSTIINVRANDLTAIINHSNIDRIFVNGKTAKKYFDKYTKPLLNRDAICLPSTSPANAAWSVDRLITAWRVIKSEE